MGVRQRRIRGDVKMLELVLRWEGCGEQKFVAGGVGCELPLDSHKKPGVVAGYGVWGGGEVTGCRYKGFPVSGQYLLRQSHCRETWGLEWGK